MCTYQTGELVIMTDQSYPDHWRKEPFYARIKFWSKRSPEGFKSVFVHRRGRVLCVFPEGEIELGPLRRDVGVQTGYRQEGGKLVPYARYIDDPGAP